MGGGATPTVGGARAKHLAVIPDFGSCPGQARPVIHSGLKRQLARRIHIVLKTAEKKKDTDDCYF